MTVRVERWVAGALYARFYGDAEKTQAVAEVRVLSNKRWQAVDLRSGDVIAESKGSGPDARWAMQEAVEQWDRERGGAE